MSRGLRPCDGVVVDDRERHVGVAAVDDDRAKSLLEQSNYVVDNTKRVLIGFVTLLQVEKDILQNMPTRNYGTVREKPTMAFPNSSINQQHLCQLFI
jgi:hypothetical protein